MGQLGYSFLSPRPGSKYRFALGLITASTMLCGTRHAIIFTAISILTMSAAFLWGAPWRWGQGHPGPSKAIRRTFLVGAASLLLLMESLANDLRSALGLFFGDDGILTGSASQFHSRVVEYPWANLQKAFEFEHWVLGYRTGTASLGTQYVASLLGQPPTAGAGRERIRHSPHRNGNPGAIALARLDRHDAVFSIGRSCASYARRSISPSHLRYSGTAF